MWDFTQGLIIIFTIMGMLLGIPFFMVFLTKRENENDSEWIKASDYYAKRYPRLYFAPLTTPILSMTILSSLLISEERKTELLLLSFLSFYFWFYLPNSNKVIWENNFLKLATIIFTGFFALLMLGKAGSIFSGLVYLYILTAGTYLGFKLHHNIILYDYRKYLSETEEKSIINTDS